MRVDPLAGARPTVKSYFSASEQAQVGSVLGVFGLLKVGFALPIL